MSDAYVYEMHLVKLTADELHKILTTYGEYVINTWTQQDNNQLYGVTLANMQTLVLAGVHEAVNTQS